MENFSIGLGVDSVNGEITSEDIDMFFSIDMDEAAGGMDVEWMVLGENDGFT